MGGERNVGLPDNPRSSMEVLDMALKRFSRTGDVEKKGLLSSRDDGRCCQDNVPALLRSETEGALGDDSSSFISTRDPLRLPLVVTDSSSGMASDLLLISRSGVRGVGSSCSGGSMARRLNDEVLSRALSSMDGESFVGDIDRARSTLISQRGQYQLLTLDIGKAQSSVSHGSRMVLGEKVRGIQIYQLFEPASPSGLVESPPLVFWYVLRLPCRASLRVPGYEAGSH